MQNDFSVSYVLYYQRTQQFHKSALYSHFNKTRAATSSVGSSASFVVSTCQPSTSSAGSSASSVVSTCQPSTSSAGSPASSVDFTRQPSTSSAPASKMSSSATPTASEIDDLFKIKSQCQLIIFVFQISGCQTAP